jgi:hypothetical protein
MSCQSAVPATFVSLRGRPASLASTLAKQLCLSNKGGYAADVECPMQMEMTPYLRLPAASHRSVGLVSPRPGDRNSSNMDTRVPSASKLADVQGRGPVGVERRAIAASQWSLPLTTCGPVAGIGSRFYRFVLG